MEQLRDFSDIFIKSNISEFVFWRPFWKVDWRKMIAIVQARDAKARDVRQWFRG